MDTPQICVLHLKKGENKKFDVHRLEKGWILRFLLDPSLHSLDVRLFCNYPLTPLIPYDRNTYHELQWKCSTKMRSALTDTFAEIRITRAGSFNYYFTVDKSATPSKVDGQGFFLVDPVLMLGLQQVSLDSLCIQSVITKLLGPFREWESRLAVARETGYNVIHFTPVQELGISNSAYCIREQHRLSFAYSDDERLIYLMIPHMMELVQKMYKMWKVLSLTDIILNHTSVDSSLLECHPDCAYNMENSPHLRPAYVVDRILHFFSLEVADGKWEHMGLPACISNDGHIDALKRILLTKVFPKWKILEFYLCNKEQLLKVFIKAADTPNVQVRPRKGNLTLLQDPEFRRNKTSVDMDDALRLYLPKQEPAVQIGDSHELRNIDECCKAFMERVDQLNQQKKREIMDHVCAAIENYASSAFYRFVDNNGPRLGRVSKENPIMHDYFVMPAAHDGSVEIAEQMMKKEPQRVMAVSGQVMSDHPLRQFAKDLLAPEMNVYFRRELVPWGDNVKLRYGQKSEDCPHLWEYMRIYVERSAQVFHGVRLRGACNTPIHVAEYMLDKARLQRPELYVLADLSTGDRKMDNYYINRLGINSLIKESLSARCPGDILKMVAEFSGEPLGSFEQPRVRTLVPSGAHSLLYDQTQDDDSVIQSRCVYDLWPNAAVVAMTKCAIGSSRGYDQLVPHHIDAVTENRLYPSLAKKVPTSANVYMSSGILLGKRLLNELHIKMAKEGFNEIHVEELDFGLVKITRHNTGTHESIILIASTVFHKTSNPSAQLCVRPVHVEGVVDSILFEGNLCRMNGNSYVRSQEVVNGYPMSMYCLKLHQTLPLEASHFCMAVKSGDGTEISFKNFSLGTVVVVKCSLSVKAKEAVQEICQGLGQFGHILRAYNGKSQRHEECWATSPFKQLASQLTLADLNRVLYRVCQEEEDDKFGFSAYHIPGYGNLCYCGLRGVMSALAEVRGTKNLSHPLCENLRDGDWLMDYTANRLLVVSNTKGVGKWLEKMFGHVKQLPRFLVPCYFASIITGTYLVLREMALQQFSDFVKTGSTFVQALALSCTQFLGHVRSCRLPPLSHHLHPSPRSETVLATKKVEQAPVSMASGLPHFAGETWRCWGRDTFIALRGMMLVTGRYFDARCLILAYAGTLRHGLIPNLLREGTQARYNCRDAVWWWLQAIKTYTLIVPEGQSILSDPVVRIFPVDEASGSKEEYCEQPLYAVIQEALSRHMMGFEFRERGAGYELDPYMSDEGFTIKIGVSWPKGYVFGGSAHNCGTWMDFMGRSESAGTAGKPATSRDGSAVEIVGLSASVLSWLAELSAKGIYPYKGVAYSTPDYMDEMISFKQWSRNIRDNFEKDFFVSTTPSSTKEPTPDMIARRGIYKDCINCSQFWTSFQLRPNFCVAMVVAPELFNEDHAWTALSLVQDVLLGPLGMKTLDPQDWAYCGNYSLANDCTDPKVAEGFNYHNGPEFVWLLAYFLRAKLHFASKLEKRDPGILKETVQKVNCVLSQHYHELMNSPWKSLPQLTNTDGAFCKDSCRAQATSDGCILEVLYDLERLGIASHPSFVDFQGGLA